MYCSTCGHALAPDSRFCADCGTAVETSVPAPPPVAASVRPSGQNQTGLPFLEPASNPRRINNIVVMVCAIGLLVAFFLPWVSAFGAGASAFDATRAGSYAYLLWIAPLLAVITVMMGLTGSDTRWPALICGTVPIAGLVILYVLSKLTRGPGEAFVSAVLMEGILRTASIGLWLTVLGALGMIGFGARSMMDIAGVAGALAASALVTMVLMLSIGSYQIRSKMSEVVLAASTCRTTITEVWQSSLKKRIRANEWGCESAASPTHYVSSITTSADGRINLVVQNIGPEVDGRTLTMYPGSEDGRPEVYVPGGVIRKWVCGGDGTTVDKKYLPESCRGGR